jgi:hypothetical protein
MRIVLFALFLLGACGGNTTPAPETPAVEPGQPAPEEATPTEPEEPESDDKSGECVEACVQARQMQATAPEVIRAQCEEECQAGTDTP